MRRLRATKVSETTYRLDLVSSSDTYAEATTRAMRRALNLSELSEGEFFAAIRDKLEVDPESPAPAVGIMEMGLEAVMAGVVIPCADVLLAAAEVADTPLGILLDESSLADEVRRLMAEVRFLTHTEPTRVALQTIGN